LLVALALSPALAKKPAQDPVPVPTEPLPAVTWVAQPGPEHLVAEGPVRGVMGSRLVEMRVGLAFAVAPAGAKPVGRFAAVPLATTATLSLTEGAKGNVVRLELPATLGPGVSASAAPARPTEAIVSNLADGSDARPWPGAEAAWVLEITDWQVTVPAEPPAAEGPCGTASGRVAVFLHDTWGQGHEGQLAGTFAAVPVRCGPAVAPSP
jgi:hypothetical protein